MDGRTAETIQRELRQGLLPWLMAPLIASGILMAFLDLRNAPPPSAGSLGLLTLLLAFAAWALGRRRQALAAWTLSLGALGIAAMGWHWFPGSASYPALVYPVVVAAVMLGWQGGLVLALLATGVLALGMFVWAPLGGNGGSFAAMAAVLWGVGFVAVVAERPQEVVLAWMWQGYDQARKNLEMARDRQVELKQALEDLDLANREVTRLNDLLSAAREAVEEARRAKEQFVAAVSHELRTPLNMIIGFSDEILERPELYSEELSDDLLADVAAIKRNSEQLARLVDDVLDLVEAESGFVRLSREWTTVKEIVDPVCATMTAFFAKKSLELTVHVQTGLPPVYCDQGRIRQVLLNLLSNAARFTQRGGARVQVGEEEGMLVISVSDTGPGIEPAKRQSLFEPFQQADPSIRRKYGGTGLGLAISRRFVELHGGRIWIESDVGVGTTVSFALPLGDQAAQAPRRWFSPYQEYIARRRPSMAPVGGARPRVVVMEQGRTLSDLLAHYLPDLEIAQAPTRAEAAQAIGAQAAVALVLNEPLASNGTPPPSSMPAMPFDIPIVTCWVPQRDLGVTSMGVQGYLVKPIRRPALEEQMTRIAPQAKRILLVDDDEEARQLFGRMLEAINPDFQVEQAKDGDVALEAMRKWKPDLVLLDLIMPGQDGFAVLAQKGGDEGIRDIPVLVISAQDPQREPILSSGLQVTRQKGLSARDIAQGLEAIIAGLPPQFGAPVPLESHGPSPASG